MPKIADYLKILTDEEVKDFGVINYVIVLNQRQKSFTINYVKKEILEKLLNRFILFQQHLIK